MHSSRAAIKEGGDKKQLFELLNKMIIFHFKMHCTDYPKECVTIQSYAVL